MRRRVDVIRNGRGPEEKISVTGNLRSGALLEDFEIVLKIVGPRKPYFGACVMISSVSEILAANTFHVLRSVSEILAASASTC